MVKAAKAIEIVPEPIKLDLGCGPNKQEGHIGVDILPFNGKVDVVFDLKKTPWPWKTGSVSDVYSSHFVEHLTGPERIPFFNEVYRIMKIGAQAKIVCPSWSHERAYGDPTHQWPPISSWTFFYLNKEWRDANAPHVEYNCDFDWNIIAYHDANDQYVALRNMETKAILMSRSINVTTDIVCILTKREMKE